jgi:hypothetical protein
MMMRMEMVLFFGGRCPLTPPFSQGADDGWLMRAVSDLSFVG